MEFSIKKNTLWIWLISLLFVAINTYLIAQEFYYFMFIPFFLLVGILGIFYLDLVWYLIVFMTPLSLKLSFFIPNIDFNLYLPTEPLMIATLFLVILKLIWERKFDTRILSHPVSLVILLQLAWIFITSFTSTMPLVSFKFLFSRLWFVVVFYFLATQIFTHLKHIRRFFWMYIIPFGGVIIYTLVRHAGRGLTNQQASHSAVNPFYNDHTAYGAILALFLPVVLGLILLNRDADWRKRTLVWSLFFLFLVATVFSYTRAAWVSIIGALMVWAVIKLKIKFNYLVFFTLLIGLFLYSYRTEILIRLEQNKTVSSGDFREHVQSISNIANDASNLERLNRWASALRMYEEKPVFGWGPGTYQFQYAPFQFSHEKTIISTNAGDMGNAHSEYIGPLSEQGLPGMLIMILLVITVIITGLRAYSNSKSKELRVIVLSVLIGLITYFIHGLLNNFLDTDKASVPFWGFIAVLVVIDVYFREGQDKVGPAKTS